MERILEMLEECEYYGMNEEDVIDDVVTMLEKKLEKHLKEKEKENLFTELENGDYAETYKNLLISIFEAIEENNIESFVCCNNPMKEYLFLKYWHELNDISDYDLTNAKTQLMKYYRNNKEMNARFESLKVHYGHYSL